MLHRKLETSLEYIVRPWFLFAWLVCLLAGWLVSWLGWFLFICLFVCFIITYKSEQALWHSNCIYNSTSKKMA